MSSISSTSTSVLTSAPELSDPVLWLRRGLGEDLRQLGDFLTESPLQDALTESIREWHSDFVSTFNPRSPTIEADFNEQIQNLIPLLADPFSTEEVFIPLDSQAYLGVSDGETYGYKTLCIHLHHVDPRIRNRSPLNPEDPQNFTVKPHDVARRMIEWIGRFVPDFSQPAIQMAFDALPAIPELPLEQTQHSQAINLIARHRMRHGTPANGESMQERIQRIEERQLRLNSQTATIDADAILSEMNQRGDQQIQQLEQRQIEFVRRTTARQDEIAARDAEQEQRMRSQIERLEAEEAAIRADNRTVDEQINNTTNALSAAKSETQKLKEANDKLAAEEARRRKEQKKKRLKKTITNVVVAVVSAYIAYQTGY